MQSQRRTKGRNWGASKNTNSTKKGSKWNQQTQTSGTLSAPRINPDELDVRLMFRKVSYVENIVTNFASVEFSPNAAYDVDPLLGSTETYGFDEYAALYSYYRVVKYDYDITVTQDPSTGTAPPMMGYVINSNTRPSVSGTRFDLYSTNPYCESQLISPLLGKHIFRGSIEISKLLGSRAVETDDNYRALTTGVPGDLVWLAVGMENISSTTGISASYDVKIVMHVRFYGRELDLSLAGMALRINKHLDAKRDHASRKQLEEKQQLKKNMIPTVVSTPVINKICGYWDPQTQTRVNVKTN
jgi:hypothetical protein